MMMGYHKFTGRDSMGSS